MLKFPLAVSNDLVLGCPTRITFKCLLITQCHSNLIYNLCWKNRHFSCEKREQHSMLVGFLRWAYGDGIKCAVQSILPFLLFTLFFFKYSNYSAFSLPRLPRSFSLLIFLSIFFSLKPPWSFLYVIDLMEINFYCISTQRKLVFLVFLVRIHCRNNTN